MLYFGQAPEAPIDNRSLFERLEENRMKKQVGVGGGLGVRVQEVVGIVEVVGNKTNIKGFQWSQEEHEEEYAFKNNLFNRGLEEDESQFLDAVDDAK